MAVAYFVCLIIRARDAGALARAGRIAWRE
jgi:hypothetical protein